MARQDNSPQKTVKGIQKVILENAFSFHDVNAKCEVRGDG